MSSPHESIDMERFQQQVASITDQLEAVWTGYDVQRPPPLGVVSNDARDQVVDEVLNQIYEDATTKAGASLGSRDEIRAAAREVRSALQTPSTRSMICRALGAFTGKSSREITVEMTKIFLPLAIAGQLAVPASALVWGILGFAAAVIGTTFLCGDES
jgi:hypothetical protein